MTLHLDPIRTLRRLLPGAALFCACVLAAPPARAQGPSAAYQKGALAFKQGKMRLAYKTLIGVVRKYPDHQPSHLLLGRIMFRSGKISKAARFFKRVPPDLVPPDAGYEYGVTMFTAKDCKKANGGFARVPSASRYAGLAAFYRGICYMRQGDYERAEVMLGRAKRLPSNLEPSRRQALAQTRKALRAERRGQGSGANPYFITPTPPPPVYPAGMDPTLAGPPPDAPAGGPPPAKKPPPPPPPPPTGFTNVVTPSLTVTRTTSSLDFHGFSVDESEANDTEIKLAFKSKYDASPRPSGGQPYASIGVDVAQKQSSLKGVRVNYIAYENDPGTIVEQANDRGTTSATLGAVNLNPEVGYPVSSVIDVSAGFRMAETYPDMKAEGKSGTRGPYGAVSLGFEIADIKLSGNQTEVIDPKGEPVLTSTTFGGELSKNWESASASVAGQQTSSAPKTKPPPGVVDVGATPVDMTTQVITGSVTKSWDALRLTAGVTNTTYALTEAGSYLKANEDGSLKFELGMSRSFEFGGSVSVTAAMTQLQGYKKKLDDKVTAQPDSEGKYPAKLFRAEGQSQSVLASFKLAPLDWLFGSVSYKYTIQTFNLSEITPFPPPAAGSEPPPQTDPQATAKLEGLFQQSVPEVLTEFKIQVGVSKTF